MKYFYVIRSQFNLIKGAGARRFLFSYLFPEDANPEKLKGCDVIMDSGAFTAWTKGEVIDIDEYKTFCKTLPEHWVCVNLDVIPKTGSTKKDIQKCAEESLENYLYLKKDIKNLLPVYHYGEKIEVLKKYMELTDYIGLSPANDTHEKVKRIYLKSCFKVLGAKYKTHGFGYSSIEGMKLFPFYSVDSHSYKRGTVRVKGVKQHKPYLSHKCLRYLQEQEIKKMIRTEGELTRLWAKRGIVWKEIGS